LVNEGKMKDGTYVCNKCKQNYEVVSGEAKLIGNQEKPAPVAAKPPVVNQATKMTKDELTAVLGESHKEFVANLSDEQVAAIAALKATPAPEAPKPAAPAPVVANSLAELAVNASPVVQAQLNDAIYATGKLRNEFVEKITTNKKCQFTADELQAWPLAALEKLASLATNAQEEVAPVAPVAAPTPFYLGSPAPLTANSGKVTETGFGAPSTL
jgi:ribosomal protein L11